MVVTRAPGLPQLRFKVDPPGVFWYLYADRERALERHEAEEAVRQRRLITPKRPRNMNVTQRELWYKDSPVQDSIRRELAYACQLEDEEQQQRFEQKMDAECLDDETLLAVDLPSNTNSMTIHPRETR
jgi:hypothetical protein